MKQDIQEDIQERLEKVDAQGMLKSSAFLTEQWMCGMDWLMRLLRLTVCIHSRLNWINLDIETEYEHCSNPVDTTR